MKYYRGTILLITGLFLAVLIIPNLVSAQTSGLTPGEIKALISKLQEQIKELQAQLDKLQGTTTAWCHTFNVDLKIGDEGSPGGVEENDVDALEKILIQEGFSVTEHSSNFPPVFDERMASAVSGFQEKYRSEILTPLGLKNGTGYVGKSTRAKLNSLYGCGVTRPRPVPLPTPIPTPSPTPSFLTVISPNGGETVKLGNTVEIKFKIGGNNNGYVDLFVFPEDRGEPYYVFGDSFNNQELSPGEYKSTWIVPQTLTPGKYRVKVYLKTLPVEGKIIAQDTSDAPFSIVAAGTQQGIVVTFPQAYQQVFPPLFITGYVTGENGWSCFEAVCGAVVLFDANGKKLSSAALEATTEWLKLPTYFKAALVFNKPNTDSGYLLFSNENPSGLPQGNRELRVPVKFISTSTPTITVISPNGGEVWHPGETQRIRWSAPNSQSVRIYIYDSSIYGSGSTNYVTPYNQPVPANIGYYDWVIPPLSQLPGGTGSKNYRIRIEDYDTPSYSDTSDAPFSIVSPTATLTITTASLPNATIGQKYYATLEASGGDGFYEWKVSQGSLPPGLSLFVDRVNIYCVMAPCPPQTSAYVSGAPTTSGSYTFTLTVTSGTQSASKEFTIVVSPTFNVQQSTLNQVANILESMRGIIEQISKNLREQ